MTNDNKYIPDLRFPEFQNDGEWKTCKLLDIAKRKVTKNRQGLKLPVYTNSAIGGVVNQEEYFDREIVTKDNLVNYSIIEHNDFVYNPRVSTAAPVGPISRNKLDKGIMSPLYLIFGFHKGDINFYEYYFKSTHWHNYLKAKANYGARFDRINIATDDFMDMPMPYPSLREQKKIADCLSSLDKEIDTTKRKLEQLKEHKKGLMQKLFPAKSKTLPELRFPEFQNDGEWEVYALGQIFSRITEKNTLNNQNVLTISAQYGLISQYDYFNKNVAALDVSKYYLVNKGDFAYNKSKSQGYPYGAIKALKLYNQGVVSPIYICFRIKDNQNFSKVFFEYYFESELIHKEINSISQEGARNHGLLNISTEDFFAKINLYVPSLTEQFKIANTLSSIDKQIAKYDEKIKALELHKQGLMQQLFPKL
ncbi:MAG: restriction endonuclease subunit S [Bacteroidales bacterium]|nr:restriction endonuclease subunit S [Bacteroidales bacterium]